MIEDMIFILTETVDILLIYKFLFFFFIFFAVSLLFYFFRIGRVCSPSDDRILLIKEISLLKVSLEKERKLREDERNGRINGQQRAREKIKELSINGGGYRLHPIGFVRSPFPHRRGTPRQPILVQAARGYIKFDKQVIQYEHYKELEQFSHLWIIWIFHENTNLDTDKISAKICPPRLHGQKVGCLSTRSPHRPNPIGLSVVEIKEVTKDGIEIIGLDLIDGTPILDVKPYIPYDIIPSEIPLPMSWDSNGNSILQTNLRIPSWIHEADIDMLPVEFLDTALLGLGELFAERRMQYCKNIEEAKELITQVLRQDIRSIRQGRGTTTGTPFSCSLDAMLIEFITEEKKVLVVKITDNQTESEQQEENTSK